MRSPVVSSEVGGLDGEAVRIDSVVIRSTDNRHAYIGVLGYSRAVEGSDGAGAENEDVGGHRGE